MEQCNKKGKGYAHGLEGNARHKIKGNPLDFYLEELKAVRSLTKEEFAKRDDDWLFGVRTLFPTKTYKQLCEVVSCLRARI